MDNNTLQHSNNTVDVYHLKTLTNGIRGATQQEELFLQKAGYARKPGLMYIIGVTQGFLKRMRWNVHKN